MNSPDYSISTPENVDLHLELAGIGNRVLACTIDTLITYAIAAAIWIGVFVIAMGINRAGVQGQAEAISIGIVILIAVLATFVVVFGYFIFFESIWQGQTPGKRWTHIRVIDQNGQPVATGAIWMRNLMRFIDLGIMMIGVLVMVVDKNERRIGDLAAGSLVIRERAGDFSVSTIAVSAQSKEGAGVLDVGRVSPQEYELLVSFLKRRAKLSRSQRPLLAKQLSQHFANKLGEPESGTRDPEILLEQIYTAYQMRAE